MTLKDAAIGSHLRYSATVRLKRRDGSTGNPRVQVASVALISDREATLRLQARPQLGTPISMEVELLNDGAETVLAKIQGRVVGYTLDGECLLAISGNSRLYNKPRTQQSQSAARDGKRRKPHNGAATT
jgi:hypothetical protein